MCLHFFPEEAKNNLGEDLPASETQPQVACSAQNVQSSPAPQPAQQLRTQSSSLEKALALIEELVRIVPLELSTAKIPVTGSSAASASSHTQQQYTFPAQVDWSQLRQLDLANIQPWLLSERESFARHVRSVATVSPIEEGHGLRSALPEHAESEAKERSLMYDLYLRVVLVSREVRWPEDDDEEGEGEGEGEGEKGENDARERLDALAIAVAASNAISVLNAAWLAGHCPSPFRVHADFAGVNIPYAILDEAQMHATILTCANLKYASLLEASFKGASTDHIKVREDCTQTSAVTMLLNLNRDLLVLPNSPQLEQCRISCAEGANTIPWIAVWLEGRRSVLIYNAANPHQKPVAFSTKTPVNQVAWYTTIPNLLTVITDICDVSFWEIQPSADEQDNSGVPFVPVEIRTFPFSERFRHLSSLSAFYRFRNGLGWNAEGDALALHVNEEAKGRTEPFVYSVVLVLLRTSIASSPSTTAKSAGRRQWNPRTDDLVFGVSTLDHDNLGNVRWSPDGKYLTTIRGAPPGHLDIWQVTTGNPALRPAATVSGLISTFAWMPNRHPNRLAVVIGHEIKLYEEDPMTSNLSFRRLGSCSLTVGNAKRKPDWLAWHPDGDFLIVGCTGYWILAVRVSMWGELKVVGRLDSFLPKTYNAPIFWKPAGRTKCYMLITFTSQSAGAGSAPNLLRFIDIDSLVRSAERPTVGMAGAVAVRFLDVDRREPTASGWKNLVKHFAQFTRHSAVRADGWDLDIPWLRMCVAISPDGKLGVVGCRGDYDLARLELWDMVNYTPLRYLNSVRVSRGRRSKDGWLRSPGESLIEANMQGRITAIQWHPNSEYIAVALRAHRHTTLWILDKRLDFVTMWVIKSPVRCLIWDKVHPILMYGTVVLERLNVLDPLDVMHINSPLASGFRIQVCPYVHPFPTQYPYPGLISATRARVLSECRLAGVFLPWLPSVAYGTETFIAWTDKGGGVHAGRCKDVTHARNHNCQSSSSTGYESEKGLDSRLSNTRLSPLVELAWCPRHRRLLARTQSRLAFAVITPDLEKVTSPDAWINGPSILLKPMDGCRVGEAVWSPDGSRVAGAYFMGSHTILQIWDSSSGRSLQILSCNAVPRLAVLQPPAGQHSTSLSLTWNESSNIIACATEGSVLIWKEDPRADKASNFVLVASLGRTHCDYPPELNKLLP